ncbi:MAG: endonuclease/exonuclease/phosphatase family protein [Verrucomicrobia bacterium]|nr:endonuclease/exonuclease/phosphatase family protein [Verrucomicrobiota bacterium]
MSPGQNAPQSQDSSPREDQTRANFRGRGWLSLKLDPWDLVAASGVVLSTATILGFLGGLSWFLDLFSHFRIQYLLGLLITATLLLFNRRRKAPAVFIGFALVNLCTVAPFYLGNETPQLPGSHPRRALLMNVNTEKGSPTKVAGAIRDLHPEFVVLEEVSDRWISDLADALREYPHSVSMPREDNFGIAVYSRHPFASSEIAQLGSEDLPSAVLEVNLPEGQFTLLATHPLPPSGRENSLSRNEQLEAVAERVRQAKSPVLLLGDLNATPWCQPFKNLLNQSGLRNGQRGAGLRPTWPTYLPLFLIPIDHCLHTDGIILTGKTTGPNVGSDHLPLIVDFVLQGKAMPSN